MVKFLLQDKDNMPCALLNLKKDSDFAEAAEFLTIQLIGESATVYEMDVIERALRIIVYNRSLKLELENAKENTKNGSRA